MFTKINSLYWIQLSWAGLVVMRMRYSEPGEVRTCFRGSNVFLDSYLPPINTASSESSLTLHSYNDWWVQKKNFWHVCFCTTPRTAPSARGRYVSMPTEWATQMGGSTCIANGLRVHVLICPPRPAIKTGGSLESSILAAMYAIYGMQLWPI